MFLFVVIFLTWSNDFPKQFKLNRHKSLFFPDKSGHTVRMGTVYLVITNPRIT